MTHKKVSLTFVGDNKTWQIFRQACKLRHSDASKELRKFMDKFIDDNIDLIIEDNIEKDQIKQIELRAKAEQEHEKQSKMSFK